MKISNLIFGSDRGGAAAFLNFENERFKAATIAASILACAFLTYYLQAKLVYETIPYTHIFYIPIILASLWWGKRGIPVAVLLASLLIFNEVIYVGDFDAGHIIDQDLLVRAPLFLIVSIVVALLTEQIEKKKRETIQSEAQIKLLYVTTKAINEEANDFNSAMGLALKEICRSTGWVFGEFWLLSPDRKCMEFGSAWNAGGKELDEFQKESMRFRFECDIGLPGQAWAAKKPAWVMDITRDPAFLRAAIAKKANLKAGMAIPVLAGGEVIAVMDFFMNEQRKEEERLIHLVSMVAVHLGTVFERKKAEDEVKMRTNELMQAEKMSSLGMLVAGVAHEINNPLAFMKSNTEFAIEDLSKLKGELGGKDAAIATVSEVEKFMHTNAEGIKRIAKITKTLKAFAKPDTAERTPSDVNQGIMDTLTILQNQLKHRIDVHEEFGKIPKVNCNIGQINQVFMNVIMNASEAMDKGDIWIKTWEDDSSVCVDIKDNGPGIPKDKINYVFNPFFTTKEKGTGLGLSVSYKIIKDHNGDITVESEAGKGTTMKIRLPKAV